jgi:lysyl endopeptidase
MKQKITVIILALSAFALQLSAQINIGGTPVGITSHLISQVPVINMPSFNLQQLQAEDAFNDQLKDGAWRFGHMHEVSFTQQNSGAVFTTNDGGRLWLLGIHSAGALSLNLIFKNFNLPTGAKMFVYSPDGTDVLGAFTNANNQPDGNFATEIVLGESAIIEYYEPAEVAGTGTFELSWVTHAYRGIADYVSRSFGDAGSCQVNVACPAGLPWANEIKSVCLVVVNEPPNSGFCSGALINNVRQDGTPYVLTANHCGSSNFSAWLFRFNWQSPTCSNPATSPAFNSISGSVQVAANGFSDFSLLRMNSTPPANYNVYYSGWSNLNVVAPSIVGIHHPAADIKKISFATGPTVTTNYAGVDCWQVGPWTTGTTEPGSSGSPAYDPNHHIVGQLFAGTSACGLPQSQQYDVYGKFATSWANGSGPSTRIKDWLDPDNTCATILDGYDPNAPLFTLDAEALAILDPVCNSTTCVSSITPSLKLRNRGTTPLTSVTINYKLDSNPISTFNWTGNLGINATTTVTLPSISPAVGGHTYTIYTTSPNSAGDQDLNNDTAISAFTIIAPTTMNLPIVQSFQNSTFPPTNWTRSNPDGGLQWQRHATAGGFGNSPGCAYLNNFLYTQGSGQSDFLNTPYLNFSSSATSPLRLYFDWAYAQRTTTNNDSLIISYSLDCGYSWIRLYNKGRAGLATNGGGMVTTSFLPSATQWKTDSVNLDALAGQARVQLRFENKSGNGNNLYVDNINILHGIIDVGIDELVWENSINIFPNPSDGNIQIELSDAIAGAITLSLYNSYGQKVYSEVADASRHTLNENFNALPKGVYFLHVSGTNGTAVRKIVLD